MSLRLGLFYPNSASIHVQSPDVTARTPDLLDFETHTRLARAAEETGFDYAFMADGWGSMGPHARAAGYMDPILLTPMLAMPLFAATTRLRVITTIHTSWFHPLLIARVGGMLDAMSRGRWGINIVSGSGFSEGFDKTALGDLTPEQRYERAAETVEILLGAWAEADLHHHGRHFQIDGRLVGPRAVQKPRPLIVSAGASDAGRQFAGRYADYIFMPGRTPQQELRKRVEDIRRIATKHGRPADSVKLQVHASVVVRATKKEADEYSRWIADTVDLELVAEYLNSVRSAISTYDDIYRSLGELEMRQVGSVAGARKIHGDADEVADHIERLHREFGCDGVAVSFPAWCPEEVQLFGELVLPRLAAKGIWTRPEERGSTW